MKEAREGNRVVITSANPAIERNEKKCKRCGMCKLVCNRDIAVDGYYDVEENNEPICIHCGRCSLACPFGALKTKSQTQSVFKAISNKNKIVVFSVAPATRVSFGEFFGFKAGINVEGKMVAALKSLGADFVFDAGFGADMTVVEEANEFVQRLLYGNKKLPQFSSCCPAWVRYVETFMPEHIQNLSSSRSPLAMHGTAIKTYFAKQKGIDPKKIFVVAVAPCTAKKAEFLRKENNKSGEFLGDKKIRDVDAVITTAELAEMVNIADIEVSKIKPLKFDGCVGYKSGSGLLFGKSSGVLEAILRTAYFVLNGKDAPQNFKKIANITSVDGVTIADVSLGKRNVKVAAICGTAKAREFVISNAKELPDFIEVMACEDGCVGGAGQSKTLIGAPGSVKRNVLKEGLLRAGKKIDVKCSHNNPEIKKMYKNFFGTPLSEKSLSLLHTTYIDRSKK